MAAEQRSARHATASFAVVARQRVDEARRHRLLAGAALLREPNGAAALIEVLDAEAHGAGSAGTGLEVDAYQKKVEGGIRAGGPDGVDELG